VSEVSDGQRQDQLACRRGAATAAAETRRQCNKNATAVQQATKTPAAAELSLRTRGTRRAIAMRHAARNGAMQHSVRVLLARDPVREQQRDTDFYGSDVRS
jgi:hypothetical protein